MFAQVRYHQTAARILPPSHERFRTLDTLIIAQDQERSRLRRLSARLRKRWIERSIPAYPQRGC